MIPTLVLHAHAAFSWVLHVCCKSTTAVSTYLYRYWGDLAPEPPAFCFEVLWNEGALDSEDKCGLDQTAQLLER